ncbi:hypothetical protein AZE42_10790 [Rhizopogon vesiculosus]|uniref:Reverse transcriptase zinc-binding domain-containing protein n=1 Tax=Rhizopogon vesiculosus TaxID=180088 RepID=A0A1J8QFU0_9AGAM|nr:hypothetical protein AZE42_10790 [Rhizopogon vesiculosus]
MVPGNKTADEQAKLAAGGDNSEARVLPRPLEKRIGTITLPTSKSALKQQFHHKIKKETVALMTHSPRYPPPSKSRLVRTIKDFSLLVAGLQRRYSSLLFQLRTGHAPLNKYLHRITKFPNPTCQHCHLREETVHHFLIVCPSYARQCHKLQEELGPRSSQLKNLLNEQKCISPLFRFIASTCRLEQVFGDVIPPSDDDG